MENESNTPFLRFRGYTDAWGQERLGEMLVKNDERNKDVAFDNVEIVSNKTGFTKQTEQFDDYSVASADLSNYYVIRERQFAYNPSRINVGSIAYKEKGAEIGVVSPLYISFSTKEMLDDRFLWYWFKTYSFDYQRHTLSEGGVRDTLSFDKIAQMEIKLPGLKEQQEIGRVLHSVDSLLSLHQRKLEKLQEIKKSLLQNMFPAEGEDRPKIRFGGYTDAWGQERLGDVADIVGGGTPSTNVPEYWDGDINWFAPAELAGQRFAFRSLRRITKAGLANSSAKMLPVGTVLFTSRAGIGTTAILTEEASTNQGFQSIVPHKDELDSYFVYSMTPKLKKYGETKGAGSTFVEVSGKQMSNMPIMLPKDFKEQQEIGKFFQGLDDLLSLHQRSPFLAQTSPANALMTRSMSLFSSSWMMWR